MEIKEQFCTQRLHSTNIVKILYSLHLTAKGYDKQDLCGHLPLEAVASF